MSGPPDPVVAVGAPSALADVLVLNADRRLAADRCAELFAGYPGLSMVVIADQTRIDAILRNGTSVTVRSAGLASFPRAAELEVVDLLYAWWCSGSRQLGHPAADSGGS